MTYAIDAAQQYADLNLYVLPCDGKKPLISGAFHNASTDLNQIDRWWRKNPTANVGIACKPSGLVVIDIDQRHDGYNTLDELESVCELPGTPTAQTGGDGLHYFFRAPKMPDRRFKGDLGPGVDIKYNGHVLASPSIHPETGERYRWIVDLTHPFADLPQTWLGMMLKPDAKLSGKTVGSTPLYTSIDNNTQCDLQTGTTWTDLPGWGEIERPWIDRLMEYHHSYIRAQPSRGWTSGTQTRSELECSIVTRWVHDGASDAQIIDLADAYLPRHIEELPKRGNDYINRTISNTRMYVYSTGWITSPLGGHRRKRDAAHRWTSEDELEAALSLVDGQT